MISYNHGYIWSAKNVTMMLGKMRFQILFCNKKTRNVKTMVTFSLIDTLFFNKSYQLGHVTFDASKTFYYAVITRKYGVLPLY